jgi:hypothetical protein
MRMESRNQFDSRRHKVRAPGMTSLVSITLLTLLEQRMRP